MPALDPLADLKWAVRVEAANVGTQEASLTRRRVAEGVRQYAPPAPLQGLVFEPEDWNGASVLVLGGSEGGLFPSRAAPLAASGFRTFALAYFQHAGSPSEGPTLPPEYFDQDLRYLVETGLGQPGCQRV